jgi:hypothetical protein
LALGGPGRPGPNKAWHTAVLLGALALVCHKDAGSSLLIPVARRAARAIERRLTEETGTIGIRLQSVFSEARRHTRRRDRYGDVGGPVGKSLRQEESRRLRPEGPLELGSRPPDERNDHRVGLHSRGWHRGSDRSLGGGGPVRVGGSARPTADGGASKRIPRAD